MNVTDLNYARYLLASQCMPALLKYKPSSLIRINLNKIEDKSFFLHAFAREANQFGCNCSILFKNNYEMLLFIYHAKILDKVLQSKLNQQFLQEQYIHYEMDSIPSFIRSLKDRMIIYYVDKGKSGAFPHEIGLLLGYPLEDVKDFIKYQGKNYIICGYWKVYHNAEDAVKIFKEYKKIREEALNRLKLGDKLYIIP